ncbi:MAG: alanine:cation symporter family protein [Proteobacteria bacterium]|nr:alanine:cation symporter family protein [Pseudomonadota bacterium]
MTLTNLDQTIESTLKPFADWASGLVFYKIPVGGGAEIPFIVAWLLAGVLFCTLYFRFVNIRHFKDGFKYLWPKNSNPNAPGSYTYYEALATNLSGTVGLGNIAGVAVGLSAGGPGAAVWLCLMGFMGMSVKFAEATLAVKYRTQLHNGEYVGGPQYYLAEGLKQKGKAQLGRILAVIFAVCCIGGSLGGGNMFQSNQTFKQFVEVTGGAAGWWADKGWLFGLVLAVLVGLVIIGGLKSIVAAASKITPIMGIIYLTGGLVVIGINYEHIGDGIALMFREAFTPEAGLGAFLGAVIWGVRRAIFSNEAGLGTAGIMQAGTKTDHPVPAGFVAMLGAFFDTVVICMVTALVLIFSGVLPETRTSDVAGVELTSQAFATVLPWFPYVLAVTVFLFAYSTLITWFYYGLNSAKYLMGDSRKVDTGFKVVFLGCVVLGAAMQLSTVVDIADVMFFIMAIPNLIGIYMLADVVKHEYSDYMQRSKK